VISKEIDIEEIDVDEIDNLSVKKGTFTEDHAIEHAVNQITDRPSENQGEGQTDDKRFMADFEQVDEDSNAGGNRKDGQEQFPAHVNAERHSGVFDERDAEKFTNDRKPAADRNPQMEHMKEGNIEPFDEQLCNLVDQDDNSRNVQNTHRR
jgi:hypothetical protein